MTRTTIDFGIDLGTTNSSIGVLKGTEVEVIRNNEGFEYTPSAVFIDRRERLHVGRTAKEQLENDPGNAISEFKLQMGTREKKRFERSGRAFGPEELSAEVLKSLRHDVLQRTGEELTAAVITVPAAFDHPQCDATNTAARFAGLSVSPLLQEPVAAALAHGFQSERDKVFWLVYDFGGGTFDAAVVQVRDGIIQVVNHAGDNHLGGKLIDWAIVEQLFVPTLCREYRLTDFRKGEAKWRGVMAKLKMEAEEAKIRLSRGDLAEITIDYLGQDDRGTPMQFNFELRRTDLERIAESYIVRSINLCKRVLAEKRLGTNDIEQVVLVGGPTLSPYLREHLLDTSEGLGIHLNFTVDPLTVVARGAAIFAGTQRLEQQASPVVAGQFSVSLEYKPVGVDVDPLVGGRVSAANGASVDGYTLEFVNTESRPPWRSGRIRLAPNGVFMTNLWAEKGKQNTYVLELFDTTGTQREVVPNRITYTVGMVITDPPLIHAVGVAMANNEMDLMFPKGTPLPAKKRVVHRTAFDVKRGYGDSLLRIPVVEGESIRRADRNQLIGELVVGASEIRRDLPSGSEVEITIEIDQSRLVRARAYIPLLDEEYEGVMRLEKRAPDMDVLERDVRREKNRHEEVRAKAEGIGDGRANNILDNLDRERIGDDIDRAMLGARDDRGSAAEAEARLLDLRRALDAAEDALEWPALVAEAQQTLRWTEELVREHGDEENRRNLAGLRASVESAIQSRDPSLLREKISQLNDIRLPLLLAQPGWWVGYFEYLKGQRGLMSRNGLADQLIAQGDRAIATGDLDGLKSACNQLANLLPEDEQEKARGYGGTTVNR